MRQLREKPVGEEAASLVHGQRQEDYGDPLDNLKDIAAGWSTILGVEVDRRQVAHMMVWLKMCRDKNGRAGRDNEVDICGYAMLMQFEREDREQADRLDGGLHNSPFGTDTPSADHRGAQLLPSASADGPPTEIQEKT